MKKVVLRLVPQRVQKTKDRLRGMEKVDEKRTKPVNYGDEDAGEVLTSVSVKARIEAFEAKIELYNKAKVTVADLSIELDEEEKEIASWSTRILNSAKGKFNGDSALINLLGGTRLSERKPARRKEVPLAKDSNMEISKTA